MFAKAIQVLGDLVSENGKLYNRIDELCGLHFTMGWKYDIMAYKLAYFIGSIWLCVTVWKAATGGWSVEQFLAHGS